MGAPGRLRRRRTRSRPVTNYQRGRAFEYRVRNKLLDHGSPYIMRAAQSKGAFDLAVFWRARPHGAGNVWLVQCKTGSARMSPADRAKAVELARETGHLAVLAQPRKGKRGIEFIDIETQEEITL